MALTNIAYLKLPDVPYIDHQGMYNYLMQLDRIVRTMAGRLSEEQRIILKEDLDTLKDEGFFA